MAASWAVFTLALVMLGFAASPGPPPSSHGESPAADQDARDSRDLALSRYDTLLRYLAYENTVYWTRAHLLLVANAALLGFVSTRIPTSSLSSVSWTQLIVLAVVCLSGMALTIIWHFALAAGSGWISHWTSNLARLEGQAFGDMNLVRERPTGVVSAQKVARATAFLFTALWVGAILFLVLCGLLKWLNRELF
jgi:hypothetical protein